MNHAPKIAQTHLATDFGEFDFYCFAWSDHEEDHLLCAKGRDLPSNPLVRIQSACYTGEIFRSRDCDCRQQLETSLARASAEGGLVVYMLCDGRGAGIYQKTLGLELGRTEGLDTSDAYARLGIAQDPRSYVRAAYVIRHFGLSSVRLLTNNPRKLDGLQALGISATREPLEIPPTEDSRPYLVAKAKKMGHLLSWV